MEVILASSSTQRRELLKKILKEFQVLPSDIKEEIDGRSDVCRRVEVLALKKAQNVADKYPDAVVIGGDTIVERNGKVYGKPKDNDEAIKILKELRGTRHRVITGIAVVCKTRGISLIDSEVTNVKMRDIRDEEIEYYVKSGEGEDKSGGYAVQEKGDRFIEWIEGDYYNVVGLPLKKLLKMLKIVRNRWHLNLPLNPET